MLTSLYLFLIGSFGSVDSTLMRRKYYQIINYFVILHIQWLEPSEFLGVTFLLRFILNTSLNCVICYNFTSSCNLHFTLFSITKRPQLPCFFFTNICLKKGLFTAKTLQTSLKFSHYLVNVKEWLEER